MLECYAFSIMIYDAEFTSDSAAAFAFFLYASSGSLHEITCNPGRHVLLITSLRLISQEILPTCFIF